MYKPNPVDAESVSLSEDILELSEELAKNTHEIWAKNRIDEGWSYGAIRNDELKEHPSLVPYEELPESEKMYDRNTSLGTLKLIVKMGYQIEKKTESL